jgi:hypothetical protein
MSLLRHHQTHQTPAFGNPQAAGISRFGQFRGDLHRQQYAHAEITRKKARRGGLLGTVKRTDSSN